MAEAKRTAAEKEGKHPLVVGIGEALWDVLPSGKQLGGAPTNFAYHAAALGLASVVVSRVGDDALGRELCARLHALGLSSDYISTDPSRPTGTVTVDLEPGGKPVYTIHEGVAWDAIPTTRELVALAGRARAVCFGTLAQRAEPSRRAIRAFLEATPAEALRVFDINLRQSFWSRETVEPSLELANAVKLNDEELPRVASLLAIEGSGTDLLTRLSERFGLRLVALTCGDQGSVLFAEGRVSRRPAAPAGEVADTIGAGDSFTATLVAGWLRGLELDRIHAWAGRVAGFVCTRSGATPELPAALREPPDGAAGS